jgi:Leu/Phe-tRNA-protein transferase
VLWSRLSLLSLVLSLSAPAFANTELNQKICEKMLGTTLVSAQPLEFDLNAGLGMRGFLGAYPEATGDNSVLLASQGVMFWGHSFAVKKSLAEAQAHDAKFTGLSKIAYLISDVDVSDLHDDTPDDIVRERFEKIFATADFVYWDDTEAIIKKQDIPAKLVRMDKAAAAKLIVPETIGYFTRDDRGPRFTQSGWVFPKIRGELNYKTIFESGSTTIKKIMQDARKFLSRGYTITFNTNYEEALNMVRDQARVEKDESGRAVKVPENSRYREPAVYGKALEGYRSGHGFSVEVRDPQGKLVGGILGERHGNIVALETTFYGYEDRPDGTFKSQIDFAKMAVLAALKRLHEHGIDVVDANMVTPFTASLKGEYVSAAQFAGDIERLRRMPPIEIDLTRPWSPD